MNLIKEFVRETVLLENIWPKTWYHGSPYCCMESASDFDGNIMFVTDSKLVASEYTRSNPGLAAGRKPGSAHRLKPTIYTVSLLFDQNAVFDMRKPEHKELYIELKNETKRSDPDDAWTSSNIVAVHPARGSSFAGVFPSFGIVIPLLRMLEEHGFVAAIVAEGGPQGASLGVSHPQHNIEIVSHD